MEGAHPTGRRPTEPATQWRHQDHKPPHHSSRIFTQAHSHLPFPPPSPACPWIPAFYLGAISPPMRQLKPNIQKTKAMASGPITSWQTDGETVSDFILWGSKITADGDCSHEIKRHLFLGKKVMTNLDSILKSRDVTLPTKVHLVKGMVFPVVMYECESWTIKKAESRRMDAFELWCWRRLLRVPWTARKSNQSIPKEISPEYSLEGLTLKLTLQYVCHLMRRTDSLEKTQMLGKIEGGRRRGDDRR